MGGAVGSQNPLSRLDPLDSSIEEDHFLISLSQVISRYLSYGKKVLPMFQKIPRPRRKNALSEFPPWQGRSVYPVSTPYSKFPARQEPGTRMACGTVSRYHGITVLKYILFIEKTRLMH